MHPPVSSKPYRTRTLASVALLVIGLIALALLSMPQLYSHGIEFAPFTLSHDTGTWLAALGAPGALFGLLLHRQADHNSLGKALLAPNTTDLPLTPDEKEVPAALASLERTLLRMAKGDLSSGKATRLPSNLQPLASAIESVRVAIAGAHDDIQSSIDAASLGGKTQQPNVTQPGIFGKTAMKLELLLQDVRQTGNLTQLLEHAANQGDFSASQALPTIASPVEQSAHRLLQTLDTAFGDVGRIADALAVGDLTQRIETTYPGRIGEVCKALNGTVLNLRETMGRIEAVVDTVAEAARDIADGNATLAAHAQDQAASLEETASSMEEINAVVQQNAETAHSVTQFVDQATAMAEGSNETMRATRQTMGELADSAQRIEAIVGVIDTLAFQTNILALNAAVEAARAGEHGRGFAVVATEVRQLSLRSGEAAQDIRRLIAGTVAQTGATIARVESLGNVMGDLIATIRQINDRMRDIHSASQEQAGGLAQVSQAIMRIDDATQQTSTQVEEAAAATKQLYGQSRGLHHLLQEFDLGSAGANARKIHHDMPPLVRQAAADVGRLWEMAIGKNLLSEDALFDDAYQPFGDSEPPKYHTRFDSIADKLLPRIQETFLKAGAHVTYAIACDRNGYVPTHNQRYCQPLTGDPEHDRLHNRSKRLFSDPVGRRCGKHPLPFLLQTYRRDTGEIVHDISAPVYVNGKHWGGFRVGYKTMLEH